MTAHPFDLTGKTALITGSSRGIGKTNAKQALVGTPLARLGI